MAPRTAKAKKAADVKVSDDIVAENGITKKGRGKAKIIEDVEQELPEVNLDEKPEAVTEKKANKRGKKVTNEELSNGGEAPVVKKGRKKVVEEPMPEERTNGDSSPKQEINGESENEDQEAKEAPAPTGKGRKKPAKKEEKAEVKPKGRKAKQDNGDAEDKEEIEEKPKGKGRGRKAQPKPEAEPETEDKTETVEEEAKPEPPAAKGRKKPTKAAKERTPESDEGSEQNIEEEPKKKESKGKKAQAKKGQAKEETNGDEKEEPAAKKRKVTKKEEKGKDDKEDIEDEEELPEAKPTKAKRGQKKPEEKAVEPEPEDEAQDTGEPTTKRKRKPAEEKASSDAKTKAAPKNINSTNYESIDFSNNSKDSQGKEWNFKIASWNVDGVRAWLNKGGLDFVKYEKPDIFCLQEIKCSKEKLPDEIANLPGYHAYWLCSEKDGYAGVGIYTTKLAMSVQYGLQNEELDSEGRIITAEYEQFYLICTYVPNSGRGLVALPKRLQWNEEFRKYVMDLDKKKPVIICGDMNVAHNEIDLTNPKTNKKNAGFTEEERSGMTELLGDGFVDTYRHLNPDKSGAYTFWTYMKNSRAKNVGWRLDYFLVSERLLPSVCDNVIRSEVYGSDHCPLTMFLNLTTADKPKE